MTLARTASAGRSKILGELYHVWVESGENWMRSKLMQNISTESKCKRSGGDEYVTFRDLVLRHGQENAEKLRSSKKEAQRTSGDAYPEVPHWMTHPDFKDDEVTCRQVCAMFINSIHM